jgi:mercuric ion binding protein
MNKIASLILALLIASPTLAATQTATLSVPTMSCASCPVTIKAALTKVPGVTSIKSDLGKRQTTIVYDDSKTNIAALSKATADAGFPSSPVEAAK